MTTRVAPKQLELPVLSPQGICTSFSHEHRPATKVMGAKGSHLSFNVCDECCKGFLANGWKIVGAL
jgi:hypothetical protein